MQIESGHEKAVRKATWLAAFAGSVASGIAVLIINDDFAESSGSMVVAAGAISSGTLTMPLLWRWLVPFRGEFGMVRAMAAGAMSAIISSVLTSMAVMFILLGDGIDFQVSVIGALLRAAGVSIYFAVLSNIFVGWITIPLGMVASTLVTLLGAAACGLLLMAGVSSPYLGNCVFAYRPESDEDVYCIFACVTRTRETR